MAETGDATAWIYDEATGLLQQKLYADNHGPCYNYTDEGKLSTRTWARGVTTTYSYDGWNQLTNTVYSDSTPSVSLAYDAMGRQISATDAAGTTTFSYTDYGEPLSETWGGLGNKTLLHHYDSFGRDAGYSVGGTRKTTIGYDSATGRLSTMNEGGNFMWSYLPGADLKSQVVYPNGVTVDYTYEQNRDLLTNVHNHLGETTYSEYTYTNDALGRRTAKNAETYGYNDRNELTSAVTPGATEYLYAYDDIGNRLTATEPSTTSTYTANELNQYTLISGTGVPPVQNEAFTPTYDLDGNQTLVETSTGIWQVSYNGENRPVTWTRTNDNTVVTMDFDRLGRRTFYKEMVGNTQVTFTRFSSEFHDDTLGLVCYNYRFYNPIFGRWLMRDPASIPEFMSDDRFLKMRKQEGISEYDFLCNSPIANIDKLGLICGCCFKGGIGKLDIDESCRGNLRIWVIDEDDGKPSPGRAGTSVSADGFALYGQMYKIDGSTCVEIRCTESSIKIEVCVNKLARILGKKAPYPVKWDEFGPGKTPDIDEEVPYVE